ncbi:CmpA/NrtA family ABC transporter substrate-binding protein, partial [Rhizobiaceae sp. 2RAB30]
SCDIWAAMHGYGASGDFAPLSTGRALARVISDRRSAGKEPLRFAVVHPHSGHNYELRYWLAACGVDPEREIEIVIVPPTLMADALGAGRIDGYCVGEPWNTAAVAKGVGRIVTTKAAIWRSSPEKVLGVAASWAAEDPETLSALLRALYRAAEWCGTRSNHAQLARMLASPAYVDCPADWLLPALSGFIDAGAGETVKVADFFVPHAKAASFPWKSHALWFYSQMVRWGQVPSSESNEAIARGTYRPDLYRAALRDLGVALPGANAKVEGGLRGETPVGSAGASLTLGPDGFFDGAVFDPDQVAAYLVAQRRQSSRV